MPNRDSSVVHPAAVDGGGYLAPFYLRSRTLLISALVLTATIPYGTTLRKDLSMTISEFAPFA
jgi:hypothetical protein